MDLDDVSRLHQALGPVLTVQIREPDLSGRALLEFARAVAARGPPIVINGRADVALCIEGAGLHLPEAGFTAEDGRRLIGPHRQLGCSRHTDAGVAEAADAADYVTISPIFDTAEKGPPIGLHGLRTAIHAARGRTAIYALGGVSADNVASVWQCDAAGVAAIGWAWKKSLHPTKGMLDDRLPEPT